MEITTRTASWGVELTYKSGNAVFTEDVSKNQKDYAEQLVENHLTACREVSNSMGISDLDFVFKVVDAFLNDSERTELIEKLNTNT